MRGFILLLLICGSIHAQSVVKKAVFDLTTSDLTTFENRVIKAVAINSAYYESKFEELNIIIVVHGGSYKFFLKDITKTKYKEDKKTAQASRELKQRLLSLIKTYNVKFRICGVGLEKNNIDKENVYDFVEVIRSAMVGLIDAQSNGYSYVPVE